MKNIYTIKERKEEGKESNLQYLISPNCPSECPSAVSDPQILKIIPNNHLV